MIYEYTNESELFNLGGIDKDFTELIRHHNKQLILNQKECDTFLTELESSILLLYKDIEYSNGIYKQTIRTILTEGIGMLERNDQYREEEGYRKINHEPIQLIRDYLKKL